jgi:anti-sigma B factor antagonist
MEDVLHGQVEGDTIYLTIFSPRVDASIVAQFKEEVAAAWRPGLSRAVVEMSAVEFIDSSGIGALLSVYRQIPKSADAVTLRRLRPQVQSVIELLRLHRIFKIES